MIIQLSEVVHNPFRDLTRYPLHAERIDKLMVDIKATGFNGGLVGRMREDGKLELAFGHHRVEALRKLGETQADFSVQNLSDDAMLQKMSSDNDPAYSHGMETIIECVRAAVIGFAEGRIQLAPVAKHTASQYIRYAPSFIAGLPAGFGPHPYTQTAIAEKLGLANSDGHGGSKASMRVEAALRALELEELGLWSIKDHIVTDVLAPMTAYIDEDNLLAAAIGTYKRHKAGFIRFQVEAKVTTAAVVEGQRRLNLLHDEHKAEQKAADADIQRLAQLTFEANKEESTRRRKEYREKQAKRELREKEMVKERKALTLKLKKQEADAEAARKAQAKASKEAYLKAIAQKPIRQPYMPELTKLIQYFEEPLPAPASADLMKKRDLLNAEQKETLRKAIDLHARHIKEFWQQLLSS